MHIYLRLLYFNNISEINLKIQNIISNKKKIYIYIFHFFKYHYIFICKNHQIKILD